MVHEISRLMMLAWQRDRRYCPPTAEPVPASRTDIGEEGYRATARDFHAPVWNCLGLDLEGERLRFQYEVLVPEGTRGRTFEVVARGRPLSDGPAVELRRVGTLSADRSRIDVTPAVRREF